MSRPTVYCSAVIAAVLAGLITAGCESLEVMPGAARNAPVAGNGTGKDIPRTVATAESADWSVSVSPARLSINKPSTVNLVFTLKAEALAPGGGLKILFPKGLGLFQSSGPLKPNYITVNSSNPAAPASVVKIKSFDPRSPWDDDNSIGIVSILVNGVGLRAGDRIEAVFGDNAPAGSFRTTAVAFSDTIEAVYDLDASGVFKAIEPMPAIETVSAGTVRLGLFLPSVVRLGESVIGRVVAYDAANNISNTASAYLSVSSTDAMVEMPNFAILSQQGLGRVEFPVIFRTAGVQQVRVRDEDGLWNVHSNPVKVVVSTPAERIYWGDLHTHSKYSFDAFGTSPMPYARDVSALDFCAQTDHTTTDNGVVGINPREWENIKREVAAANQPGRFVSILGYEFNALPPTSHHNVLFDVPNEGFAKVPLLTPYSTHDIRVLWREIDRLGIKYLTIPHHTGKLMNIQNGQSTHVSFGSGFANSTVRPLMEIYSWHGQSESYNPVHPLRYEAISSISNSVNGPHYAQDALALGEQLGFVASSDTHGARPGIPPQGITAIYATELTREALFDAMRKRRTYATTGARMIVDFSVASAPMGSKVRIGDRKPEVRIEVHASGPLEFVELLRYSGKAEAGHPVFETVKRVEDPGKSYEESFIESSFGGGPAVYYVRARQEGLLAGREGWAWSSPVWVNY